MQVVCLNTRNTIIIIFTALIYINLVEKKSSRLDKIKNISKNSKYISILREIFIGLAGAHAVYIFINFVFGNYPGGLLSILL